MEEKVLPPFKGLKKFGFLTGLGAILLAQYLGYSSELPVIGDWGSSQIVTFFNSTCGFLVLSMFIPSVADFNGKLMRVSVQTNEDINPLTKEPAIRDDLDDHDDGTGHGRPGVISLISAFILSMAAIFLTGPLLKNLIFSWHWDGPLPILFYLWLLLLPLIWLDTQLWLLTGAWRMGGLIGKGFFAILNLPRSLRFRIGFLAGLGAIVLAQAGGYDLVDLSDDHQYVLHLAMTGFILFIFSIYLTACGFANEAGMAALRWVLAAWLVAASFLGAGPFGKEILLVDDGIESVSYYALVVSPSLLWVVTQYRLLTGPIRGWGPIPEHGIFLGFWHLSRTWKSRIGFMAGLGGIVLFQYLGSQIGLGISAGEIVNALILFSIPFGILSLIVWVIGKINNEKRAAHRVIWAVVLSIVALVVTGPQYQSIDLSFRDLVDIPGVGALHAAGGHGPGTLFRFRKVRLSKIGDAGGLPALLKDDRSLGAWLCAGATRDAAREGLELLESGGYEVKSLIAYSIAGEPPPWCRPDLDPSTREIHRQNPDTPTLIWFRGDVSTWNPFLFYLWLLLGPLLWGITQFRLLIGPKPAKSED